jgi:fluoride exporter
MPCPQAQNRQIGSNRCRDPTKGFNPGGEVLAATWAWRYDAVMMHAIFAISIGSALGAVLRWQLGLRLNEYFPTLPPGTLVANIAGGYIIGLAVAFFANASDIAPEWRLFIITGFCGGLTTFSTFSAEVVTLLQAGRFGWAVTSILTHVGTSLIATIAGLLTWALLHKA